MTTKRIIGKIDIKGKNVIKGMRFEGLRFIEELTQFLSKRESDSLVDEIYINNITGSLYDTHLNLDLLEEICKNIHIPITVQGGISSLQEIENLLKESFPEALIKIDDLAGDGNHYAATIVAREFKGLNRVKQHQMVYTALKGKMDGSQGELHALALTTKVME